MKLAKQIFSRRAIDRAVVDYKGLAKIQIEEDAKYWYIDFVECKYDLNITEMEFENYMIGLENASM